jgi:ParB-like chromosome segregation protein Spo0J
MSDAVATRQVVAIHVGHRHRQQLGDLQPLASSMATLGLLHPVVITPDDRLVAGARRLAAAQQLGWTEIPVRVIDLSSMLQAEHDENMLREPFLPTEAVAIGRALEDEIAAANAVKMRAAGKQGGRGKKKENPMANDHRVLEEETTRAKVGKAVGMGGKTYTKAKAVVLAAEERPEDYGDLVTQMDSTGSVDKAYQTMQRRKNKEGLPGKSPHQVAHEDPARRWTQSFHDLYKLMNSVRHFAGDLRTLTQTWSPAYRTQSAAELRRMCAVMQEWIVTLEEKSHE